jgi:hypothetical protein
VWPVLIAGMHGQSIACFFGMDEESQAAATRLIAAGMKSPLLTLDLQAARKAGVAPPTALHLALRDARMTSAIAHLAGLDACLEDGYLPQGLLAEMFNHPDLVITSGRAKWQFKGDKRDRAILWQEFPALSFTQQRALWRFFLGEPGEDEKWDSAALASQFHLQGGQIRDAVALARDIARQRGNGGLLEEDLLAAARMQSSSRLDELAHQVASRYQWADLVLPPDQLAILKEVVTMVRARPKVLEEWGVGKKLASSTAVTVLFAGEPGTGKTMAAGVIASELGLELYKIDLSSLVSKYIGETEKNLEVLFKEAEQSNAILFFDEADAVFGKRSGIRDAHDRYANIGVSYLLQRMEAYDGVTILATNLRANLDEAFTRRLQFVVDFPFPDEAARLRIWETLFPPEIPRADDVDLAFLAQRFKLAGGSIRNIIVNAAFKAAEEGDQLAMEHLLHAARRELQKMGRLLA